jgi:DNA repair photolyase
MKIGVTERGDAGLDFSWKSFDGPKILITKSPQNLCNLPDEDLKDCIVHCTITGLGETVYEPNVAGLDVTLPAYQRLVCRLGSDRVVLRIDPIILGVDNEENIIKILSSSLGRVRVSFLDMYDHVRTRFNKENISIPKEHETFHADLRLRQLYLQLMQGTLRGINSAYQREIEVCGEPDMLCSGCVSARDLEALNLSCSSKGKSCQRKECHCIAEKYELLNNKQRCPHKCIYCYWKKGK